MKNNENEQHIYKIYSFIHLCNWEIKSEGRCTNIYWGVVEGATVVCQVMLVVIFTPDWTHCSNIVVDNGLLMNAPSIFARARSLPTGFLLDQFDDARNTVVRNPWTRREDAYHTWSVNHRGSSLCRELPYSRCPTAQASASWSWSRYCGWMYLRQEVIILTLPNKATWPLANMSFC